MLPLDSGKTVATDFGQRVLDMVARASLWEGRMGSGTILSKMQDVAACSDGMGILLLAEGLREVVSILNGDATITGRDSRGFFLNLYDGGLCE